MIFKPPKSIATRDRSRKSIFLAGSIEMGIAENWQDTVSKHFEELGWNVFNPRRDYWDSSWKQEFESPQFFQQVYWELTSLEASDLIVMYFDPATKSPVSMLELGLFARSGKLHVICPDGFWRKGNIDVTCQFYNVPLYESIGDFLAYY